MARYAKKRGLRTNVITNGHYVTHRNAHEIAEVFDLVSVSLDSGLAEHHDACRGDGSWRRAAGAIDLLLDAGAKVDINSVITKPGLKDVDQLLAFARRRGIGDHRIVPQSPMGRGADKRDDELTAEDMVGFEDKLYALGRNRNVRSSKGTIRDHCGAGLSEVSIDPEGWLYPCKLLQYESNRVGNVRQSSVADLIDSSAHLGEIRQPLTDSLKPCVTCIIRNNCGGGCRGIHASYSGSWDVADPLFCAQLRRNFELQAFASTGSVPGKRRSGFDESAAVHSVNHPQNPKVFISLETLSARL